MEEVEPEGTRATLKKRQFLDALTETGSITEAAAFAKVHRRTVYKWKDADPDFKNEWATAYELGLDALEDEAVRRGRSGVRDPIYHQGKIVGHVRKYSDTLLMFMLNGGRPQKFRRQSEDGGAGGSAATVTAVQINGGLPPQNDA